MNGTISVVVTLLLPRVVSATVTDDTLSVDMEDGRTVSVPIGWFPRRHTAPPQSAQMRKLAARAMDFIGLTWMKTSAWKDFC